MESVQFVKNKPKTPPTPADGLAFVRMGSNEGYDLPERMKAFYAKYHRRKLRKNEKGAADLVREARESR